MTTAEFRPAATYPRASSRSNLSRSVTSNRRSGHRSRSVARLATLALIVLAAVLAPVGHAGAATRHEESLLAYEMFLQLNDERAARGLSPLQLDPSMDTATRRWSETMESSGVLSHSTDGRAEIVAYGWSTGQITDAWMRSPGHRHLITDPNLVPASVSISCDRDGRMWAVVQFRRLDTSLPTQSSSSASPIVTPDDAGGTCENPPADVTPEEANAIKRLYRAYFLRDADSGGLAYWRSQAANGMNIWMISEHFASSVEFDQRYGSLTDAQFIDLVYRNVMGRSPDAGGESYWLDRMKRGTTRGQLMTYFSDSPEYRAITGLG